eukprot:841231-Prymnesium_polylepis.1
MPVWLATSADEQAVSMESHGPCMPSANETRPATTEHAADVPANTLSPASVSRRISAYSHCHIPTNTPVPLPFS